MVAVTATDPVVAGRSASAEVTVTATGTMYVLDEAVYVYGDLHQVDGDVAPDRTFSIDGVVADDYFDMAIAPALDLAFITSQSTSPMIFRVPSISTASGTITDFAAFGDNGYEDPAGIGYDATRDILNVHLRGGLLAFDDASTAPDGATPDRVLTGANVGSFATDSDIRLALDVAANRLFLSEPNGTVAVYDNASTVDGNLAPDRLFTVDVVGLGYLWGSAYDSGRDELYLGDQRFGAGVYVIANASTATAGPLRVGAPPDARSADARSARDVERRRPGSCPGE